MPDQATQQSGPVTAMHQQLAGVDVASCQACLHALMQLTALLAVSFADSLLHLEQPELEAPVTVLLPHAWAMNCADSQCGLHEGSMTVLLPHA